MCVFFFVIYNCYHSLFLVWSFYSLFSCFKFFFFKQKTAYEMRISDWSSDVCSSDLNRPRRDPGERMAPHELDESRDRERGPAPHAEPGGGHMDIQNARRLALLVIAGHQHQPRPRADEQQRQPQAEQPGGQDRKSTRLNSSH